MQVMNATAAKETGAHSGIVSGHQETYKYDQVPV